MPDNFNYITNTYTLIGNGCLMFAIGIDKSVSTLIQPDKQTEVANL